MYIAEHEVRAVLRYETLIPAMRQALIDYSAGLVDQPARTILRAGNAEGFRNGWFAVMPVIHGDMMGVKTVTFYPGNAELGLHTHMAVIELLRRSTGEPLAVMDGRLITEMRTAAVSAVALDALAPASASSLGILGSGVQARSGIGAAIGAGGVRVGDAGGRRAGADTDAGTGIDADPGPDTDVDTDPYRAGSAGDV